MNHQTMNSTYADSKLKVRDQNLTDKQPSAFMKVQTQMQKKVSFSIRDHIGKKTTKREHDSVLNFSFGDESYLLN